MSAEVEAIKTGFFILGIIIIIWSALIYWALYRIEKAIRDPFRKEGK